MRARRLAIAVVLGLASIVGVSCWYSLPDVLTPGPDGGPDGAGGGSTWTGTVLVDCTWDATAEPCGCYGDGGDSFYCGHAVLGAGAFFFNCIPPPIALSNFNDLLSCHDGVWSLGTTCASTCKQETGIDAADVCYPTDADHTCQCYKDGGDALYCAHAVMGYADYHTCVPPILVRDHQGALLHCTGLNDWSFVEDCPKGCRGDPLLLHADDTCCPAQ